MKRIAILVASVLVLGGFTTKTFADEPTTQASQPAAASVSYKDEAGITPDSLFYTIDKAIDQLRLMLASSEEQKSAVSADIAKERLGESEVMTAEGKIELAKEALKEYSDAINEAASKLQVAASALDKADDKTSDDAVETENDSKDEQKVSYLENSVQDVQNKSLEILNNLENAVPKDSTDALAKIVEEQQTHKTAVENFVKERHDFNAAKKALNMARVALNKAGKSGNDAVVKAAQDKFTSAQKEYLLAQTQLQTAFQAKKAADLGIAQTKDSVNQDATIQASANTSNQIGQTAASPVDAVASATEPSEAVKVNNGNGNGNKLAKEFKSAPGKSGEAHGKSGEAHGRKN